MPSVFISHSSLDNDFATKLAERLEARGIEVWLDVVKLDHGSDIESTIRNAIDCYDFLIVVLSNNSVSSAWAHFEVGLATSRGLSGGEPRVLAGVIDDCKLPIYVEGKRYVDFRKADKFEESVNGLVASIHSTHGALKKARTVRALRWSGFLCLMVGFASWAGYREWQSSVERAQMLPLLAQRAEDQMLTHPDISRKLVEELNKQFPDHPEALRIKGWSHWYAHEFPQALQAFTQGWEASGDKTTATARGLRVGMANSLVDTGGEANKVLARQYYTELINRYGHTNAYINLARLSLIEKNFKQSAAEFKEAHDRLLPEFRGPQHRALAFATTGWALTRTLDDPKTDPKETVGLLTRAICYDREVLLFLLIGQESLGHYGYRRFTAPWNEVAKQPEVQRWIAGLSPSEQGRRKFECPS